MMSLHNRSWGLVGALLGYNYLEFVRPSLRRRRAAACQIMSSIIEIGSDIFACLGCYLLHNAERSGAG